MDMTSGTIRRTLLLPQNRSLFLFGPRQTGKSTLIRSQFTHGNVLAYDFLKSEQYRTFSAHPEVIRKEVEAAAKRGTTHVVIDEVQRLPAILDEVHGLMESGLGVSFVMSGSSARKLKRAKANLLAGRAFSYHLHPLTAAEIGAEFDLDQALTFGCLPPIVTEPNPDFRREILRSYVETYLKEEIELEAQLRNLGAFQRFLPLAAATSGDVINVANIAREAATTEQSVRAFYEILEDTLIGRWLGPWHRSERRRLVRHPRFHFFDTGVVRAIQGRLSLDVVSGQPEFGPLFEHFIINQVRALSDYCRLDLRLSYYRTEAGAEVDLIIETPANRVIAVEIRSAVCPTPRHASGLLSFKELVPEAELVLCCRGPRPLDFPGGILVLPWNEAIQHIETRVRA